MDTVGGKLQVIVGGQFGSEAKGHVAAQLAKKDGDLLAIRVAGNNAGHCVVDEAGEKWKLRHVPVAAVANPDAVLAIAAGSEVDPAVLHSEISSLEAAGYKVQERLMIDPQATLMEGKYLDTEVSILSGTTGKGIGAARAARALRQAQLVGRFGDWLDGISLYSVAAVAREHLAKGGAIQIEGTQGFGLGLHAGWYPHCTSSDCRAIDFLAMAGISPWSSTISELDIWVVLRTFPIRIAGNSGPLKGETTWDKLGLDPEWTTVTNKVRRVGEWDPDLARSAVQANGDDVSVALMQVDYLFPEIAEVAGSWVSQGHAFSKRYPKVGQWVLNREDEVEAPVRMLGTGPSTVVWL